MIVLGFDKPQPREYFKPANHKNAHAFLIEIDRIARNSPGYQGELKDAAYADITVFETEADLAEGASPKVYRNARVDNSLLAKELIKIYEDDTTETVRVLDMWKGDKMPKPAWVWRFPPESVREAVIEWYERREAGLEELPDFGD